MTAGEMAERVRASSGPDRELDLALLNLYYAADVPYRWSSSPFLVNRDGSQQREIAVLDFPEAMPPEEQEFYRTYSEAHGGLPSALTPPAFTGSVDAALALVERMLPGWEYVLNVRDRGISANLIWPDQSPVVRAKVGRAATLPLAILAALLEAIQSHQKEGGV